MPKINIFDKDSCPLQSVASLAVICNRVTNYFPYSKSGIDTHNFGTWVLRSWATPSKSFFSVFTVRTIT